jgi:hypothetical protein
MNITFQSKSSRLTNCIISDYILVVDLEKNKRLNQEVETLNIRKGMLSCFNVKH